MRFFIIILILLCHISKAQKKNDLGIFIYAGGGIDYYTGDLKDNMLPDPNFICPFWTVGLDFQINNIFNIGFGYLKGDVLGADRLGIKNPKRNFKFKSYIKDYHILAKLNLFNFKGKSRFTPGILFGIGLFKFEPQIFANGVWNDAQTLGTEGQNLGGNNPTPYSLQSYNSKIGLELTYQINCKWYLDVYAFYNKTYTDYLDDVSGTYPDYNQLIASENGATVANYTYTYYNEYIPTAGTPRGNPTLNDGYVNIGINLNYKLWGKCQGENGISKKRNSSCAAYRQKKRYNTHKYRKHRKRATRF
tara:strand:+ start:2201 stop:3112 length:912 start_codon:yes stop_codon:yes gene_type:complete